MSEVKCFKKEHRFYPPPVLSPASYPMVTRGSFPGGRTGGAWSWPLTSI